MRIVSVLVKSLQTERESIPVAVILSATKETLCSQNGHRGNGISERGVPPNTLVSAASA